MGNCNGNCSGCSGCAGTLELTGPELGVLAELGEIPFLPVAREAGAEAPVRPGEESEEMSLALQCLEKKGLISLDYDQPLRGCDYGGYPVRGSFALTARGQRVLELLEVQGIQE
ncbi:MAG: hypothetical protein SPI15_12850 [Candidatus Faecousia sp.]|nr:hypothetical protein [Candidatus Faecousia sp.]